MRMSYVRAIKYLFVGCARWLYLRYASWQVARSLTLAGKITKVVVEIKDCRGYIEEGIRESEVCGDLAMVAEFTMQKVLLNIMEGVNLVDTKPLLQVITNCGASNIINVFVELWILLSQSVYMFTWWMCHRVHKQLLVMNKYIITRIHIYRRPSVLSHIFIFHRQCWKPYRGYHTCQSTISTCSHKQRFY